VFSDIEKAPPVFQFVPIASGPVTGHHWKQPGCILFAPSFRVFIYADEIPPDPSLLQAEQSLLPQPFLIQERCSGSFIILVALHWTLSSMSMSLLHWKAQN